jgi:hypothetical protein
MKSITDLLILTPATIERIRRSLPTLTGKMTFSDFLTLLLRESYFRDILAEAQMYRHSACRLSYSQEVSYVTAQQ